MSLYRGKCTCARIRYCLVIFISSSPPPHPPHPIFHVLLSLPYRFKNYTAKLIFLNWYAFLFFYMIYIYYFSLIYKSAHLHQSRTPLVKYNVCMLPFKFVIALISEVAEKYYSPFIKRVLNTKLSFPTCYCFIEETPPPHTPTKNIYSLFLASQPFLEYRRLIIINIKYY